MLVLWGRKTHIEDLLIAWQTHYTMQASDHRLPSFLFDEEHWGAWRKVAACRGQDSDWWFEDECRATMKKAIDICNTCVSQKPCLEYALRTRPEMGIFGGKTPAQRRKLLKERKR